MKQNLPVPSAHTKHIPQNSRFNRFNHKNLSGFLLLPMKVQPHWASVPGWHTNQNPVARFRTSTPIRRSRLVESWGISGLFFESLDDLVQPRTHVVNEAWFVSVFVKMKDLSSKGPPRKRVGTWKEHVGAYQLFTLSTWIILNHLSKWPSILFIKLVLFGQQKMNPISCPKKNRSFESCKCNEISIRP